MTIPPKTGFIAYLSSDMAKASNDQTRLLQQAVADAKEAQKPLNIVGSGSKTFLGRAASGNPLPVHGHTGIVNYHPSESVITARSGTPLAELEQILSENGQMLGFEPPYFGASATLGGTVACGLSGPRRPFAGSVRDCVLGCKIINGKAEVLSFGGEVIKNVAGFDVSRLMVGAFGTLGLLLEVSLKVLPRPESELTLRYELKLAEAVSQMTKLAKGSLPISGLSFYADTLYIRLSGAESAIAAAAKRLGGERNESAQAYWQELNEQQLDFFTGDNNLWRISVPPAYNTLPISGTWLYDWGGALRWLQSDELPQNVFTAAAGAQGHAQIFRGKGTDDEVFQPLTGKLRQMQVRVKHAFDPDNLLNYGRMYRDW